MSKQEAKKYIGVFYNKKVFGKVNKKPFYSTVGVKKEYTHIGSFETAKEAAIARDVYIIKNNLDKPLNILKKVVY